MSDDSPAPAAPPPESPPRGGTIRQFLRFLFRPTAKFSVVTLLIVGIAGGVVSWGGFNWAMEMTNNEGFCITCHEMERNVFREYRQTAHYTNRTGVRATCPDCHVPKEWVHKVARKIQATGELYGHMVGVIDTPEKFEAKRLELAMRVWDTMKRTDSRECRNCHNFSHMDFSNQEPRSSQRHQAGLNQGMTCIDCHKGIAHKLPAGAGPHIQEGLKGLRLSPQ
ncbi:MAG: NapC/NirT family cytochrome c [Alphaproteobacteria bacterium]|nr:NapC/NirT family cytochrome c [Alphaproteobacteria bacterium]